MISLCTGGTGSIGSAVVAQLRGTVRIFSRDDTEQTRLKDRLRRDDLRFMVGDVCDLERLRRAMHGVHTVIHAAALKHVWACEASPFEALQINAVGTQNVVAAAHEAGVKRLCLVSTDKAADPINVLGASKLMAERIVIAASKWAKPRMCIVRLGNVIGSRGSIWERLPLEYAKHGTVTITAPDARRYVISPDAAARFIIRCTAMAKSGEVFIPKMRRTSVGAIARCILGSGYKHKTVGLGVGEKADERLWSLHEVPVDRGDHWVIR